MKKNIFVFLLTICSMFFITIGYAAFNSELTISGEGTIIKDTTPPTCGTWYLRKSTETYQDAYDNNTFINPISNTTWRTDNLTLSIECTDNMGDKYGCIDVNEITGSSGNKIYYKDVKNYTTSIKTDSNEIKVILEDAYQNKRTCTLPAGGSNPYIDKTGPVITITPSAANKFTYSATDDLGVKGYMVTTSSTKPSLTDSGWVTTPAEVTIDNTAAKTYYVWSKDELNITSKTISTFKLTKSQGTGTTLTLKYNNSSGAALSTGYVLNGTKVYVTGSLSTGYKDLVLKKGTTAITSGSTQTISAATTISSTATAEIYKITLDNKNATTAGTEEAYYQYKATKTVDGVTCYYYTTNELTTCLNGGYKIEKPTKTGYVFKGYYTGENGTGTQYVNESGDFINSIYNTTGNKTLYAYWTPNNYTLTVNPNGGTYDSKTTNSTYTQAYDTSKIVGVATPPAGYTVTYYGNGGTPSKASETSTKSFVSWTKSGSGEYVAGVNATVNGMTRTLKTENGETFENFTYTANNPTSNTWYSFRYPAYTYTSGDTYEIRLKLRINSVENGGNITFRHAAVSNDYGTPGGVRKNYSTLTNGWIDVVLERTISGTTITQSTSTLNVAPVFEAYTNNLINTTSSLDFDIKNVMIINKTKGTLLQSSTNLYWFRDGNGTLTASYKNNAITTATATRDGYTFGGWYNEAACTTKVVDGNASYTPTSAKTLYAKWNPISYTIAYNANTGSGTMSNQIMVYGTAANLSKNTFTKTGYTFTGWNTKADGSGTNYTNEQSVNNLTTTANGTVNLYAQWAVNVYKAKLSDTNEQIYYQYNTSKTISGTTCYYYTSNQFTTCKTSVTKPTKQGYTFKGYYTGQNGTGTQYIDCNGNFVNDMYKTTGDKTLYPYFEINSPAVPTITGGSTKAYNYQDTTLTCATDSTYATGTNIYYEFGYATSTANFTAGTITWLGSPSTTNTLTLSKTEYRGSRYYTCRAYASDGEVTSGTISTATSQTASFVNSRINFDATTNGGAISGTTPLYVPYGQTNIYTGRTNTTSGTIPTAAKEGYTFNGWYTAATDGTKVINADKTVQASVSGWTNASKQWIRTSTSTSATANILYAQYSPISYTIAYNANTGNGTMSSQIMVYDTAATLTTNAFTKTGYTFTGWNTKADGSGNDYTNEQSVNNLTTTSGETVTLYAQWAVNVYKATLSDTNEKIYYQYNTSKTISGSACYYYTSNEFTACKTSVTKPTKQGYTFKGYYTGQNGTGTQYIDGNGNFVNDMYKTTGDKTLYPYFEINSTAVPTITGGATKAYNYQDTTLTCETTSTYASGTNIYYEFGYASNTTNFNAGIITWLGSPSTTKTITIGKTAYLGGRYYTCRAYASDGTATSTTIPATTNTFMGLVNVNINFDATTNGGSINGATQLFARYGTTNMYTSRTNSTAGTIPTAAKEGYTFNGWYTAASGGTKVINADKTVNASVSSWTNSSKQWLRTTTTNNTTVNKLYAQYSPISYTVAYDANGGTGSMSNQVMVYDTSSKLTKSVMNKDYIHTFENWNTMPDGSGTTYADEASVKNLTTANGATVTLYAQYRKITMFLPGWDFNNKIKKLADSNIEGWFNADENITAFRHSSTSPNISSMTDANIVSTSDSKFPIYAWFDNGTIYWWTEDTTVYINPSCNAMFNNFKALETVEFNDIDSTYLESMGGMFQDSGNITSLDFSNFHTERLTNLESAFTNCHNLSYLDMSTFDTSHVTSIYGMFYGIQSLETIDMSTFDLSSVNRSGAVFAYAQNVKAIKTPKVYPSDPTAIIELPSTMYDSSYNAYTEINNTSPTKTWLRLPILYNVRYNANGGTGSMADQIMMYGIESSLSSNEFTNDIYPFKEWNTKADGSGTSYQNGQTVKNLSSTNNETVTLYAQWYSVTMFDEGEIVNWKMKRLAGDTNAAAAIEDFNVTAIVKSNTSPNISSMTDANIVSTEDSRFPIYAWYDNGTIYWWSEDDLVYLNPQSSWMFLFFRNLTQVDISTVNTSKAVTMQSMFYGCSNLETINLSNFNTSSVYNIAGMFALCNKLNTIDLSTFDLSNVTDTHDFATASNALENIKTPKNNGSTPITLTKSYFDDAMNKYTTISSTTPTETWIRTQKYTVKFNSNGGTGTMANQSINVDSTTNLIPNSFTKTNYLFNYWSTVPDPVTVFTNIPEISYNNTGTTSHDLAQWEINGPFSPGDVYELDFDAKGSGTLYNYFWGYDNYLSVSKVENNDGFLGTRADGQNIFNLTSEYKHYKTIFTLGSSGSTTVKKLLTLREAGETNASVQNVYLRKLTKNVLTSMDEKYSGDLSTTDSYKDFAAWEINGPFKAGDIYKLEFDAWGSGNLQTYFYGYDNYLQVEKTENSEGYMSTRADGMNVVTVGAMKHYTVTFKLGSSGDGSVKKVILFRAIPSCNIGIKNVSLNKTSENPRIFRNYEAVTNIAPAGGTINLYAIWELDSSSLKTVTVQRYLCDDKALNGNSVNVFNAASDCVLYDSSDSRVVQGTNYNYSFGAISGYDTPPSGTLTNVTTNRVLKGYYTKQFDVTASSTFISNQFSATEGGDANGMYSVITWKVNDPYYEHNLRISPAGSSSIYDYRMIQSNVPQFNNTLPNDTFTFRYNTYDGVLPNNINANNIYGTYHYALLGYGNPSDGLVWVTRAPNYDAGDLDCNGASCYIIGVLRPFIRIRYLNWDLSLNGYYQDKRINTPVTLAGAQSAPNGYTFKGFVATNPTGTSVCYGNKIVTNQRVLSNYTEVLEPKFFTAGQVIGAQEWNISNASYPCARIDSYADYGTYVNTVTMRPIFHKNPWVE